MGGWVGGVGEGMATHMKCKHDFPQEAQRLLPVSVHNVFRLNVGA